jgi:hypothetical protein
MPIPDYLISSFRLTFIDRPNAAALFLHLFSPLGFGGLHPHLVKDAGVDAGSCSRFDEIGNKDGQQ